MTVVANLTVAGITRGKRYDVIDKSDRFINLIAWFKEKINERK